MYDAIVVGCGFSGGVVARQLAEKYGKKVLILEKRSHIGGNMYESEDTNGVRVHWYGPHIFHTNNEKVFTYLKRLSDFYPYEHKVVGRIDGKLVPIPFNYHSLETLFADDQAAIIKDKLSKLYPEQRKVSIMDLLHSSDSEIRKFGEYVYEKVFVHYTAKQWNQPIEKVDKSVINRVPVVLGYDDGYFQDKYQYMPQKGFTALFQNLLNHPNITVQLNCDAVKRIRLDFSEKKIFIDEKEFGGQLIYTGALDELFHYSDGCLPYRSLDLVFEQYSRTFYQTSAVVNYPNEEKFTRITEFKYLTQQNIDGVTTILKEYPLSYNPKSSKGNIPYYPILNPANLELYQKYQKKVSEFRNIALCGRLAEYKYYNMDTAVERALQLADEIGAAK